MLKKKIINKFGKEIRENTGLDFTTAMRLAKIYMKNQFITYELAIEKEVDHLFYFEYETDVNNLYEDYYFRNGIHLNGSMNSYDVWKIPKEYEDLKQKYWG